MIGKTGTALLAASLLCVTSATAGAQEGSAQVGAHASTLGLGLSAGVELSESFTARGLLNAFDYGYDRVESGNDYEGDLALRSIGLLVDWHPFESGFRLTGGAFINNNELAISARGEGLDIGGERAYSGNLDANLEFESIAPYLGAGWASGRGQAGYSFNVDVGVLLQRTPRLSASGSIGACEFVLSEGGRATLSGGACSALSDLAGDLESEHDDLSAELDDFGVYPVVSLGLSYRF